jgi:hypothetical protein
MGRLEVGSIRRSSRNTEVIEPAEIDFVFYSVKARRNARRQLYLREPWKVVAYAIQSFLNNPEVQSPILLIACGASKRILCTDRGILRQE